MGAVQLFSVWPFLEALDLMLTYIRQQFFSIIFGICMCTPCIYFVLSETRGLTA